MGHPAYQKFLKFGITGVDMFFMISGFVIFLTLSNTKSWRDFVVSRFSRLYPVYWTCVTITFLLLAAYAMHERIFQNWLFVKYSANMTMFQHYFGIDDLDPPYWTMIVEMVFYIVMLFFFCISLLEKIETIGFFMVAFLMLNDYYLTIWAPRVAEYISFMFPLLNYFPLFLAGILFYKLRYNRHTPFRYLLLAFCLIVEVMVFDKSRSSDLIVNSYEYLFVLLIYFTLFFLFVTGRLGFIVNRVTLFLGSISYSLYLIHLNLGSGFIIPKVQRYAGFPAALITAIAVSILSAYLITRFVEQPCLKYIRKKYREHKENSAAVLVN
jgi:peptidoglycan/LPS O-acetylase OafA/YrhL